MAKKKNNNIDILKAIEKAKKILIVLPNKLDADCVGSAVALSSLFTSLKKSNQILANQQLPDNIRFISDSINISHNIEDHKSFVIQLKDEDVQIENIKVIRDKSDGMTKLIIKPKNKSISHNIVNFSKGELLYDTIIYLDTAHIEMVDYFIDNIHIPTETTSISIDHHQSNTYFADINIVDKNISSTAELVYDIFFKRKYKEKLNKTIATALFAGIVDDTSSFRNENTSAKTIAVASELLDNGAEHKLTITHLYRSRKPEAIQLWGHAISKLQYEKDYNLAWVKVTRQDFQNTNTTYEDLDMIIDEIIKNIKGLWIAILIVQIGNDTKVSLRSLKDDIDVSELATLFGGGGHAKAAAFYRKNELADNVAKDILNDIRLFINPEIALPKNNINETKSNNLDNTTPTIPSENYKKTEKKHLNKLKKKPDFKKFKNTSTDIEKNQLNNNNYQRNKQQFNKTNQQNNNQKKDYKIGNNSNPISTSNPTQTTTRPPIPTNQQNNTPSQAYNIPSSVNQTPAQAPTRSPIPTNQQNNTPSQAYNIPSSVNQTPTQAPTRSPIPTSQQNNTSAPSSNNPITQVPQNTPNPPTQITTQPSMQPTNTEFKYIIPSSLPQNSQPPIN